MGSKAAAFAHPCLLARRRAMPASAVAASWLGPRPAPAARRSCRRRHATWWCRRAERHVSHGGCGLASHCGAPSCLCSESCRQRATGCLGVLPTRCRWQAAQLRRAHLPRAVPHGALPAGLPRDRGALLRVRQDPAHDAGESRVLPCTLASKGFGFQQLLPQLATNMLESGRQQRPGGLPAPLHTKRTPCPAPHPAGCRPSHRPAVPGGRLPMRAALHQHALVRAAPLPPPLLRRRELPAVRGGVRPLAQVPQPQVRRRAPTRRAACVWAGCTAHG